MSNIIAWKGELHMKIAQWDTKNGYTVKFSIPEEKTDAEHANPFKRFTKMRGNKVGTRFEIVVVTVGEEPITVYQDEVMLKGWTDSNAGWTVTFWLSRAAGDHPFASYGEGDPFMVALVEISDDQEAVDQAKRARIKKPQRLSQVAAMMCRDTSFWEWLDTHGFNYVESEDQAAAAMRSMLDIESRKELDLDEAVAQRFHRTIRRPYSNWRLEQ